MKLDYFAIKLNPKNTITIQGDVAKGDQMATKLGYPTLNINLSDDFRAESGLKYGVYAGTMEYEGQTYYGAINIGITPCFKFKNIKLEIHVFDFDLNLYNKKIKVNPLYFMRDEMKFTKLTDLVEQMHQDMKIAKNLLGYEK